MFKIALRLITNFGPIVAFFLSYKLFGILVATEVIIAASIIAIVINYFTEGKISPVPVLSALIIATLGGITIYTGNSKFIKIKPTIINIMFALVILGGTFVNKNVIKYIFAEKIILPEFIWNRLSYLWSGFFLCIAGINEFVWRNFSEETWVNFKVFGASSLMLVFMLIQLPFLYKHIKEPPFK